MEEYINITRAHVNRFLEKLFLSCEISTKIQVQ